MADVICFGYLVDFLINGSKFYKYLRKNNEIKTGKGIYSYTTSCNISQLYHNLVQARFVTSKLTLGV